jgi:hypothetical protein
VYFLENPLYNNVLGVGNREKLLASVLEIFKKKLKCPLLFGQKKVYNLFC